MGEYILSGDPPVPLILRRSGQARRISLRISRLDGRVTLTVPTRTPEAEALAFARTKETWIRGHLGARPVDVTIAAGAVIPVEGVPCRIVPVPGRRVLLRGVELGVPQRLPVASRLQSWLRELARDRLAAASDRYADALGQSYSRLSLRDTRSRWGSCSSAGALMYSWRLVLAPPRILQYVAAHEVAHLAEMNHSDAFWTTVERLYGPYADSRRWLRTEGVGLHRYRF